MGCAGNLALCELTHCACSSVVNEVNGASCAMQPMARAPQVARSASAGTGAPGSPSFAYFSWRDKKSKSGCGVDSPTSSRRSDVVVDGKHCVRTSLGGRDVRPAAQSLSLASPRESNQREGDPPSGSLHFVTGNLRCSTPAAVQTTRRWLKQVWPDLPPPSALLGPASTGWGVNSGSGPDAGSLFSSLSSRTRSGIHPRFVSDGLRIKSAMTA
jgi:hypothetical protein